MSQHAFFRGLATGSARGFFESLRPTQHTFFRGLTTGGRRIGVQNVLGRSVPKSSVSLLKSFVSCKTFKRSARPSKRNVPIQKKRPCLRLRLRDDQKKRFCLRTKRDSKKRSATRERRNDSKKARRLEKGATTRKRRNDSKKAQRLEKGATTQKRRDDSKRAQRLEKGATIRNERFFVVISSNEQKVKKYRIKFLIK